MNKTERAYKTLLNDIMAGKLYQGQQLIEKDLTQAYNIGKTPLREALIRLERLGLVKRQINRGFFVTKIRRKDAEELYDLRMILEVLSVRKTIENLNQENIRKIANVINKMDNCVKNNNIEEYGQLDIYLHILLCESSGYSRVLDIFKNLQYQIRLLLKTSINLPERGIDLSFKEHKELHKAILARDSNKAEILIREHINNTKKAVLNYLNFLSLS